MPHNSGGHGELVRRIVLIQDKVNYHRAEYLRLKDLPGQKRKAVGHQRKAGDLQSQIRMLIHQVARLVT